MNETEIEQLNAVVDELNALSATSRFCSAKAKLLRQNYHLEAESITSSSYRIECEIQAHCEFENIEAGMSKAVFADGREEVFYFFNPNATNDDNTIYVSSLDEAMQLLVDTSKRAWYRGELLAHLHYGGTARLEYVKEICETGFIDQKTMGRALELSVLSGKPFVEYILSQGADILTNSNETIHEACRMGELDIVRYLIEKGADPLDEECILIAAREGHIDIVEYLLSIGASEATARTYANEKVDQYFQAKDFAQKLEHDLEEKETTKERGKI